MSIWLLPRNISKFLFSFKEGTPGDDHPLTVPVQKNPNEPIDAAKSYKTITNRKIMLLKVRKKHENKERIYIKYPLGMECFDGFPISGCRRKKS